MTTFRSHRIKHEADPATRAPHVMRMFRRTKFLRFFALSMALVPAAEITAIIMVSRHNIPAVSAPLSRQNATIASRGMPNTASLPITPSRQMILVNGTPVWTTLSGS